MFPSSYNIASCTPLYAQAPVFVPSSVSQRPVQQVSPNPPPNCPSPPHTNLQMISYNPPHVVPVYPQPSQAPMRPWPPQPQQRPVMRPQLSPEDHFRHRMQCGPRQQLLRQPNPRTQPQPYPYPKPVSLSHPVPLSHPPPHPKNQQPRPINPAAYYPQSTSTSAPYTHNSIQRGFGGNLSIRDQRAMYQNQYMQSAAQGGTEDFTVPLTEPERQRLFSQFQEVLRVHGTLDVCDNRLLSIFMQLPAPIRRGIKRLGGLKPFLQQAEEYFTVEGDNISLRMEAADVDQVETLYDPTEWEDSKTEDFSITQFMKAPAKSDSSQTENSQDGEDAESTTLWEICSFLTSGYGSGGGYYDDYRALFPGKQPTFEDKKQEKSPFMDLGDKLAAKAKEVKEEPLPDDSMGSVRLIDNLVFGPEDKKSLPSRHMLLNVREEAYVPLQHTSPYVSMGQKLASKAKEIITEDAKNASKELGTGASSEATPNFLVSSWPIQEAASDLTSPPATEAHTVEKDSKLLQSEGCTVKEEVQSETIPPLTKAETKTAAVKDRQEKTQSTRPKMASVLSSLATASGQDGWIQHLKSLASSREEPLSDIRSASISAEIVTSNQKVDEMPSKIPDDHPVLQASTKNKLDSESVIECSDSTNLVFNAILEQNLENILCTSSADQDVKAKQVLDICPGTDLSGTQDAPRHIQDLDFSGPEHFFLGTDLSTSAGDVVESSLSTEVQSDERNSPDSSGNYADGPVARKNSGSEPPRPDAKESDALQVILSDQVCQEIDCETRKAHSESQNSLKTSNASHSHTALEDLWKSEQHKSQRSEEDAAPEGDFENTNSVSSQSDSKEVVEPASHHSHYVEEASPGGLSTNSGELETEECTSEVNNWPDWFGVKKFLPEATEDTDFTPARDMKLQLSIKAQPEPVPVRGRCDSQASSGEKEPPCSDLLDSDHISLELEDGEYTVSGSSSVEDSSPQRRMKLPSLSEAEPEQDNSLYESQTSFGEKKHLCFDLGHLDVKTKASEGNTKFGVHDDVAPISCETAKPELDKETEPAASELKERGFGDDIPIFDKAVNFGVHASEVDLLEDRESVDNHPEDLTQDQGSNSEPEKDIAKELASDLRDEVNLSVHQQNQGQDGVCNQIPINSRGLDSSAEDGNKKGLLSMSLGSRPSSRKDDDSEDVHQDDRGTVEDGVVLAEESCSPDSPKCKEVKQKCLCSHSQDARSIKTPVKVKVKDKGVNTDEIRMCTRAISTKKIITKNFGITTDLATTVDRAVDTPFELEERYMRTFVEALQRASVLEITLQCERDLMASQKNKHNMELREMKGTLQEKHVRLMDVERELEMRRKQLMSELKKKTLEHRELEGSYSTIKSKYVAAEKQNSCLSSELESVTRQLLDLERARDRVIPKYETGTDTQELDKAQEYSDNVTAERTVALTKRAKLAELELLKMKRQSIEEKIKSALTEAEYAYNIYAESSQLSFPEKAHLVTKWTEYQNTMQTCISKLEQKYNSMVRMIRDEDRVLDQLSELIAPQLDAFTSLPKRSNRLSVTARPDGQPRLVFQFSAQPSVNPHAVPNTRLLAPSGTIDDPNLHGRMQSDVSLIETLRQPAQVAKAVGRGRGRRMPGLQHNLRPGEQPTREADSMDPSCPSTCPSVAVAAAASQETVVQDEPSGTSQPVTTPQSQMIETLPLHSHRVDLSHMPAVSDKEALPHGFRFGGPSGGGGDAPPGHAEEQEVPSFAEPMKQQNAPKSQSKHIYNMQKRIHSGSVFSRLSSTFKGPQRQIGMDGTQTVGHSARKMNLLATPFFNRKSPTTNQTDELPSAEVVETNCQPTSSSSIFARSDTREVPKKVAIGSCDNQFANEKLEGSLSTPSSGTLQTTANQDISALKLAGNGGNPVDREVLSACSQNGLTPAQRISMNWRSKHTGNHLAGIPKNVQSCDLGSEVPMLSSGVQSRPSVLTCPSQASLMPTSEPPLPAREPSMPAPEPSMPALEPSLPAPEPSLPAPEPSLPAPESLLPAPESLLPTPEPSLPTPEPSLPAPEPSLPAPEPSLPAPEPSMSTTEPSVLTTEPSVLTTEPSVLTPKSSVLTLKPTSYSAPPLPPTSYQGPPLPSTLYQGPQLTSTSYQGPQLFSTSYQGPPLPSTLYQGPQLTSTSYQGPPLPSTLYQGPQLTSTLYQGPQLTSTSYQGPQLFSTSYQGPPLPPRTYPGPPLPTRETFVPTSAASYSGPPLPPTSYQGPQLPSTYPGPPLPTRETFVPTSAASYSGPPLPPTSYQGPQLPSTYPGPLLPTRETFVPTSAASYSGPPLPPTSYQGPQLPSTYPGPLLPTRETFVPTSAALLPTPGVLLPTPGVLLPTPVPRLPAPLIPPLMQTLPTPRLFFAPAISYYPASSVYNKEMQHNKSTPQPSNQWIQSDLDSAGLPLTGRTPLYQRKQTELPPRFMAFQASQSEDGFPAVPDPIGIEPILIEDARLKKRKIPDLDQLDDTSVVEVAAAKDAPVEEKSKEAEKDEWQTQLSKRKKKAMAHLEAEQRQQQTKAMKKGSMDKLISVLSDQFPDVKPKDVMDVIRQVRMNHDGSLSGTPFSTIIAESRLYLQAKTELLRPQTTNLPQLPQPRQKELPTLQAIQQAGSNQDADMCVICQEDMNSKSGDVRMLDCGHLFHDECISVWYNSRERTCPICRCHTLFAEDFPRLQ